MQNAQIFKYISDLDTLSLIWWIESIVQYNTSLWFRDSAALSSNEIS